MSSLWYFIRESLTGFSRNLSTALGSIVTIFLSLLIIGVFAICALVVDSIVSSIESEVSITVYVADDASDEDIASLSAYIEGLEGVSSVGFTTKDEALESFRETSSSDIIDSLDGQNPLPASIDVELSDPQLVSEVALSIQSNDLFVTVCDNPDDPSDSLKYGEQTVERLFSITNYIRYIGIAFISLLIFIALIFINNTIRLAILARKKEIAIMRLVGASNGFIRGPFLMEGTIHSIIGSVMAVGFLEIMRRYALPTLQETITWLPIDISRDMFILIYVALILSGLFIGLLGSTLAMRRYLKV